MGRPFINIAGIRNSPPSGSPLRRNPSTRKLTFVVVPVVSERKRKAFTLVELLLPAIQAAREAARRSQCQANIHNVALAVLNYESAKKILPQGMTFPQAQQSTISYGPLDFGPNWIIQILPNMEEQALHDS